MMAAIPHDDGYTFMFLVGEAPVTARPMSWRERLAYSKAMLSIGGTGGFSLMLSLVRPFIVDGFDSMKTEDNLSVSKAMMKHVVRTLADDQSEISNLRSGVRLELSNPALSIRDCNLCQKWWFRFNGKIACTFNGNPRLRPEGHPTPCRTTVGCLKGTPENLLSLSVQNRAAFEHYMDYRAIGVDGGGDGILRRNWRVIDREVRLNDLRLMSNLVSGGAV